MTFLGITILNKPLDILDVISDGQTKSFKAIEKVFSFSPFFALILNTSLFAVMFTSFLEKPANSNSAV